MLIKETDNFDSLVREIERTGGYGAPRDLSYAMAVTINRMGGWVEVCSWRYRDFPIKRQVFKEVYKGVLKLLDNPSAGTLHTITIGGHHEQIQISPTRGSI